MPRSFGMFYLVVTAILLGLNAYAFSWARRTFLRTKRQRRLLAIVLGASLAGMSIGRVLGRLGTDAPARGLYVVASTVQLAVIVSVVLLFLVDVTRLLAKAAHRVLSRARQAVSTPSAPPADGPLEDATPPAAPPATRATRESEAPSGAPELDRRTFLVKAAAGSAFLIGSGSSLYGALAGRHDYVVEDVVVRIPGLCRALDGFTIVQLSDIHIGQVVGEAELAAAEDLVARARPDLVVLTGDLLDHDPRLAPMLGAFVRRLEPRAREGVVAISGNHDFYAGIAPTVAALEAGGATVLRNRGLVVGSPGAAFALLGVDDVWAARRRGGGPSLEAAVASLPPLGGSVTAALDLPRILLCHNPSYFERAAGKVALQLSGHTHGGQINVVVRPADWVLRNGWVAGSYERDGSHLYVNRGFGTVGPPARIGAPPEVTRVVLVAA